MAQMLEIVRRLETSLLFHDLDKLLLLCIDKVIAYLIEDGIFCDVVIYFRIVESSDGAVHDEFQK